MKSDQEIAKQWRYHLRVTKDGLAEQYANTERCQAFYAGDFADIWIGAEATNEMGTRRRAMVQISEIKSYVNAVKGFMAQNRRQAKYSARIDGDRMQQVFSDYANGLHNYLRAKAYADQRETQQNGDMLINGYGAIETAMSYTNGRSTTDPNGQVIMGVLDPLAVGWDPMAREPNAMDARWVFSFATYDIEDALDLFQDSEEEDFQEASDNDLPDGDDGYVWYERGGRYNKIKETSLEWADSKRERVKVGFYQWYEFATFFRCENPLGQYDPRVTQILMPALEQIAQEEQDQDESEDAFRFDPRAPIWTFTADMKKRIKKLFGKQQLEIFEYRRKAFYSAVISKDHIFTKFRNISQHGFTIKLKTGDYDSKNGIWTGMVNSMMEPTLYKNKALTELIFIIGANSKGGVLVEEDAVDDITKFEQQWAKTDAVIEVAPGGLEKIKPKAQPQTTTGYEGIIGMMDAAIPSVAGIDKAFLGSSENKMETGLLQSRRIKQVVSALACYFDAETLYQIEQAYIMLDFMRVYAQNNAGALFSVEGEQGKQTFLQVSADRLISDYEVAIEEAPQSADEKQEFANTLASMAAGLLQVDPTSAKAIMAVAIKYLPLNGDDQQKLTQILMPAPNPQAQAAQQEAQLMAKQEKQAQLAEIAAKTDSYKSTAALNTAKIQEVTASIQGKRAHAIHEVSQAGVDAALAHHTITQPSEVRVQG